MHKIANHDSRCDKSSEIFESSRQWFTGLRIFGAELVSNRRFRRDGNWRIHNSIELLAEHDTCALHGDGADREKAVGTVVE